MKLFITRCKPCSYSMFMGDDLPNLLLGKSFFSYLEIDLAFVSLIWESVMPEVAAIGLAVSP